MHEAQLQRAEKLYKQELISRTELEQAWLEVETDKIRQRNAERRIVLAKAACEREMRIAKQGLLNSREIQAAESEVRAAEVGLRQAQIRLASAKAEAAATKKGLDAASAIYSSLAGAGTASNGTLVIRAPIGGAVVDLRATLGQAVESTSVLAEIEDLRLVLVVAQATDKQAAMVRKGDIARVSFAAYPGRHFEGVVRTISNRLDPKTRTSGLHIHLNNSDGLIRNGMVASVAVGVGTSSKALVVPRTAVIEDEQAKKVFVAEPGGKFEERHVSIGRRDGEYLEVLDGLSTGEKVVSKGAFVLKSEKRKGDLKGHDH